MKTMYSILVLSILFLTASCDETKQAVNTASNVQLNGNYKINEVKGENYSSKELVLSFDALNKSVNATTECNNMFGTYSIDLYAINFGDMASTKKYCEGKMEAEQELNEVFKTTGSYSLENGILQLFSANDRSLLLKATKVRETNEN
ncbi:MAG: META domain-containing protein [Vicingaceae bacterium]